MTVPRILIWLLTPVLVTAGTLPVLAQDCQAQLAQREQQCQDIAEQRASLCPEGQAAAEPAKATECKKMSDQIASLCTRKPCGAAPTKKAKRKAGRSKRASPKRSSAKG
jgi:hypothetical protein